MQANPRTVPSPLTARTAVYRNDTCFSSLPNRYKEIPINSHLDFFLWEWAAQRAQLGACLSFDKGQC